MANLRLLRLSQLVLLDHTNMRNIATLLMCYLTTVSECVRSDDAEVAAGPTRRRKCCLGAEHLQCDVDSWLGGSVNLARTRISGWLVGFTSVKNSCLKRIHDARQQCFDWPDRLLDILLSVI